MTKSSNRSRSRKIRIIGGRWRGSVIDIADVEGLRPTPDRVRETLFNWLAADVVDAHCLDLFAGSGALSFEALSRGAASVYSIEKNPLAWSAIQASQRKLEASAMVLDNTDALVWLHNRAKLPQQSSITDAVPSFDIIFIDPPFKADIAHSLLHQLEASGVCSAGALIYLELAADDTRWVIPDAWTQLKDKVAGQVRYCLYQRPSER